MYCEEIGIGIEIEEKSVKSEAEMRTKTTEECNLNIAACNSA